MMRSSAQVNVRLTLLLIAGMAVAPATGCRLCCDTDDYTYAAYGGSWERTRRDSGRVGSIFDPAGAKASTLVQRDQPSSPAELERERRRGEPDPFLLEPDKAPADDQSDKPDEEAESEEDAQQKRIEQLRNQKLEDIDVEAGEIVPPLLY